MLLNADILTNKLAELELVSAGQKPDIIHTRESVCRNAIQIEGFDSLEVLITSGRGAMCLL
jgi:hypothetical protein